MQSMFLLYNVWKRKKKIDWQYSISDEAPEWATSTPLENYALTVGQDSDKPEQFQVVAGTKATKLEIKEYISSWWFHIPSI